jgi:spore germination protein GerM
VSSVPRDTPPAVVQRPPVTPPAPPPAPVVETPRAVTPAAQPLAIHLWFVEIVGDGTISRKEVIRSIPKTDSPLTATMQALLSGPTPSERDKGYRSLIPAGTRLLGASVKDGRATLNFSDDLQFNEVGVEGNLVSLMQIVYTATVFSTVSSVQFLIDGEQIDFLGDADTQVWIGSPLSRTTFR